MGHPSAPAVILLPLRINGTRACSVELQQFRGSFATKQKQFFWRGVHNLPERWSKCVADGKSFKQTKNEIPLKIICFLY